VLQLPPLLPASLVKANASKVDTNSKRQDARMP
jgi:hypothetical protein